MVMENYKGLAYIYDYLLSGVDYEEWADYIEQIFEYYAISPCDKIMDLACGTGSSTLPWAKRGYKVYGLDIAPHMLKIAREKAENTMLDVVFLEGDMRSFKAPLLVDAALLYQDGLNYLLNPEDVRRAFAAIYKALRPGGFFIFNLNHVEKLPASPAAEVYWVEDEELTMVWESCLEVREKTWRINFVAFLHQGDGLYQKIQEEHKERSYSHKEILDLLEDTGWILRACYRGFTFQEPCQEDRNVFYVLQREE